MKPEWKSYLREAKRSRSRVVGIEAAPAELPAAVGEGRARARSRGSCSGSVGSAAAAMGAI